MQSALEQAGAKGRKALALWVLEPADLDMEQARAPACLVGCSVRNCLEACVSAADAPLARARHARQNRLLAVCDSPERCAGERLFCDRHDIHRGWAGERCDRVEEALFPDQALLGAVDD